MGKTKLESNIDADKRAETWARDNAEAIKSYNARIGRRGAFGAVLESDETNSNRPTAPINRSSRRMPGPRSNISMQEIDPE